MIRDGSLNPENFDYIERPKPIIANSVLGMLIFIFAELMLFMGMISAFLVIKTNAVGGVWPPPGQPRLPVGETAFNTVMLLLSGVALFLAHKAWRSQSPHLKRYLIATVALGTFFVLFQGAEWIALIGEGLTMRSSNHGAFFYLLVGTHAIHAVAALAVLGVVLAGLMRDKFNESLFWAAEAFWYFVVAMWPILYWLVYL
jgi:cytochrome c oxidase subunit III